MEKININESFNPSVYNSLFNVEEADEEVRQEGHLHAFLEAAARIFYAHNMQSRFGVALLHKHNQCLDGEHMIEYSEIFRDADALITRPVTKTPSQEKAVPVVWSLIDKTFYPLEYTTDKLVCDLYEDGDVSDMFLNDFASLAKSSPIGNLLGLAVTQRDFYNHAKSNEGAIEFSGLMERGNVVFMRDRMEFKGKAIETAWNFFPHIDDGKGCDRTCFINASGDHISHHKPI